MRHDDFLTHMFRFSRLSQATRRTYKEWLTRCCQYAHKPHVLDLTPDDLLAFRLYVEQERHFAPSSSALVRAAIKYFYGVLMVSEVPETLRLTPHYAAKYASAFQHAPKQAKRLPDYVDREQMRTFINSLPDTNAGRIITAMYATLTTFEAVVKASNLKISKGHVQRVCAETARHCGLPSGFGLRGVRASGIVHRIQARQDDTELVEIFKATGLSYQQFLKYRKAALDVTH